MLQLVVNEVRKQEKGKPVAVGEWQCESVAN